MLQTRKSNPNKPPRVLIYGREGVGKSTFGARASKPVFISPEGGTDQLRGNDNAAVDEMPDISDWDSVRGAIKRIIMEDHGFETLVVDSADWLEGLAHKKIIGGSKYDIIRVNGGYSAGLRDSERMHRELIDDLTLLREKRNMTIIVTAHTQPKDAKDPEQDPYDCYQMKCDWRVSDIWKEWVDAMIFVRFRTYLKKDEGGNVRAFDDSTRVAYTTAKAAAHAKNRYGLPPEMDFTENFFNDFMAFARKGIVQETPDQIRAEMQAMLLAVTDEKTQNLVVTCIEKAGDNVTQLNQLRGRLREITPNKGRR